MRATRNTGLAALLAVLVSSAAATARAQEEPHPPPPAAMPKSEPAPTGFEPYDALKEWKKLIPFRIGANLWLYWWQPLSREATLSPGSLDGQMEIWALRLEIEKYWELGGFHIETRFRDGGRIPGGGGFGAAAQSNVWFQEGYASVTPTPKFNVRVGKMHQKMGLYWDDSFFGNLLYYDGIMLNPDWGLGADGQFEFAGGKVLINYWAQYFLTSDGVQGSYTYARTLPLVAGNLDNVRRWSPAAEGEVDSNNELIAHVNNSFVGRLLLTFKPAEELSIVLGGSASTGVVNRWSAADAINDKNARYSRLEADLALTYGNWGLLAEYLRQYGPGMRNAAYVLAGVHGGWGRVSLHVDVSYADYLFDQPIEELMLVPGIGINVAPGLNLYLDYDEWRRKDPRLAPAWTLYDRSLLLVADYYY